MISVRVDGKPRDEDVHTWADYVELLALVNMDGVIGLEFALDRLCDSPEEDLSHEDVEGEDGSAPDDDDSTTRKQQRIKELTTLKLADALTLCIWRSSAYGMDYPFSVDALTREIKIKDGLNEANYSYLFLLLCGNLPFVKKSRNILTDGFEKFCMNVFARVMPIGSDVHVFGKAATTRYHGSKLEKLKQLCRDMRTGLLANANTFRQGDNGDSGIDLVAWHGLNDAAINIPVSLAQCACSRDEWVKKQAEIIPDFFVNHFITKPTFTPFMFIPICFRAAGGAWACEGDVKNVVLMDRFRIIKNCADFSAANDACDAKAVVREISGSEGVV